MGRELRRKQAKKEGKSLEQKVINEENYMKKLFKITGLLIFIVCLIYIISALFITKELDWFQDKEDTNNKSNVSNAILASSIFKQSEEEYYVYFYDFADEDTSISSTISNKLSSSKVYKVNTGSAMNSNYVSESSNKFAKTLEELQVVSPTLIKITGEEITEYYESDEIKNNLE